MVNLKLAKKIGSIIILAGSCFAADLELAVLTVRGNPVRSVEVNSPFLVRVSIKGVSSLRRIPEVEGLSNLIVQTSSTGSQFRQGPRGIFQEVSVTHTVVADQVGTLTLGPATLGDKQSGVITIEVVDEQEGEDGYAKPEVAFELDKTEAYVGEKVSFTLTFSWQDPDISSPNFEPPYVRGVRVATFRKVRQFKDTYEGKDRYVVECAGDLYPLEPGPITIGPLKVTYRVAPAEQDMFALLFAQPQRRAARIEPVVLEVKPLPETDLNVQAVGTFTHFSAGLSSSIVPQHEAVTLVLHVAGESDFTELAVPMRYDFMSQKRFLII